MLYLPLEIFSREYLGKLALAVQMADRDIDIVFGHKVNVMEIASRLKSKGFGEVYFENGPKTKNQLDALARLKARKFKVVAQFEEAGVQFVDINEYVQMRPSIKEIEIFDQVFTWGSKDEALYQDKEGETSVVKTGTLRSWSWGNRGKEFYKNEMELNQKISKNYILFVSNLAFSNSILEKKDFMKFNRSMSEEKAMQNEYIEKLAFIDSVFIQIYEQVIETIMKYTSFDVIFRTHPVENADYWKLKYKDSPRINISCSGPVTPLVLGSQLVIHSGSTVGIESAYCDIPTISLSLFNTLEQIDWVSNTVSLKPKSAEELTSLFGNLIDIWKSESEKNSIVFNECFENFGSDPDLVLFNICEQLLLQFNGETGSKINPWFRFTTLLKNGKQNPFIRRGNSPGAILDRNKRPKIRLSTIRRDIKKLSDMFEIYDLDVKSLGDSTFLISRRKHF